MSDFFISTNTLVYLLNNLCDENYTCVKISKQNGFDPVFNFPQNIQLDEANFGWIFFVLRAHMPSKEHFNSVISLLGHFYAPAFNFLCSKLKIGLPYRHLGNYMLCSMDCKWVNNYKQSTGDIKCRNSNNLINLAFIALAGLVRLVWRRINFFPQNT